MPACMRRAIAAQASASSRSSAAAPLGGAARSASSAKPAASSSRPAQGEAGPVGPALDLLRFCQRAVAIEPPERQFGMHLEHPRGRVATSRSAWSTSRTLRRDVEQLLRHLARRVRGGLRDPTGLAVVGGIDRCARRHREHRGLPGAEQRADGVLGSAAADADLLPAGRSACRPRSPRAFSGAASSSAKRGTIRSRASPPAGRTNAASQPPVQPSTPASQTVRVIRRASPPRWHSSCAAATVQRQEAAHDHPPAPQRALHAGIERPRHREGAHPAGRRRDPRSRRRGGAGGQGAGAQPGGRGGEGRRLRRPRGVHPRQRPRIAVACRRPDRCRARRAGRDPGAEGLDRRDSSSGSASACST